MSDNLMSMGERSEVTGCKNAMEANQDLIAFGAAADSLRIHRVGVGGFVVPDQRPSKSHIRRKEQWEDGRGRQESAGERAAGSEGGAQGSRAQAASSRTAPYPVERGVGELLGLEELFDYHPNYRWLDGSSSSIPLALPVGLFTTLPYRATVVLDIPRTLQECFRRAAPGGVPFIRAWSVWSDGILAQTHHAYPDRSMCVCQPHEWRPWRNVLEDYVGFCVCWLAKALHEQLLGRWPGPQHSVPSIHLARGRADEFCHCGRPALYKDCHMQSDKRRTVASLLMESQRGRTAYLDELRQKGLSAEMPFSLNKASNRKVAMD